jgi:hypothetical protein
VTREKEKDGYILKFKARLVAQASLRHGIDYFTTFAPTIATSLHVLLHTAAKEGPEIVT